MTACPRIVAASLFATSLLAAGPITMRAQAPSLPFQVGEMLEYSVRVSRFGKVGEGKMWIEGPVQVGDVSTWRLRFEIEAGRGPFRAVDRTSSWIDPISFSIVKFTKEERHLLSRSKEDVTILADSGRWRDKEGPGGTLGSSRPLDELSFIYFLRTLPLDRDTTMSFDRHFDTARNPTIVRVMGRDTLTTPAGIFRTRVIEMEVRDPKRYKGTGIIRIDLDKRDCRVPVRIESRMPVIGTTTLTLKGRTHPPRYPDAIAC